MGVKNTEFDVEFESIEKIEKKLPRKKLSMKKWQKFFFTFITVCKSFRRVTLFGMIFFTCVLESHFTSISGLEGSVLSKKSKSLYYYIDI